MSFLLLLSSVQFVSCVYFYFIYFFVDSFHLIHFLSICLSFPTAAVFQVHYKLPHSSILSALAEPSVMKAGKTSLQIDSFAATYLNIQSFEGLHSIYDSWRGLNNTIFDGISWYFSIAHFMIFRNMSGSILIANNDFLRYSALLISLIAHEGQQKALWNNHSPKRLC